MYLRACAKLGLAGRLALVRAIEEGLSLRAAAAAFSLSPATVDRWWHRWLDSGRELSALVDRSSRPRRSPRLLAAELQERVCECRRQTGRGPRLVAGATGFAHSTVWKVLRRHGLSRRPATSSTPMRRQRPSPASWSARWPTPQSRAIVAKRLMTDNGFSDVKNRSLRELLTRHRIRHITTEPDRPRTNGKVERSHPTMAREWAHRLAYRSHRQRNQALPHWLDHHNRRRPHSSLGDRPPISRVHNLRE